jgi:hypothetical protein
MRFAYNSMHFVHWQSLPFIKRHLDNCSCVILPSTIHGGRLSPDHTFLQQHKKVGKKRRSPARLLFRLLFKLSRPLLAVPDGEKLNWLSMPIDLLNLNNNRRALSREFMTCGH